MNDGLGDRSWPLPMSNQDVALRQRCARLLQALHRIEAWLNSEVRAGPDLETFAMLTKGCVEASDDSLLEAPIYSNSQIEAAWLFLFEVRRQHFNRRMQIQDCTRVLGSSYNWSMVLFGSKKIRDSLRNMPPEARMEILEDAGAMDLVSILQRVPLPAPAPALEGPTGGSSCGSNGWPDAGWPPEGRSKKNPFTAPPEPAPGPSWPGPGDPQAPPSWPGPAGDPPQAQPPNWPGPAGDQGPTWPSAPSNPFRKDRDEKSEAAEAPSSGVTPQDMMAGAKFAQDSGLSAKDMMSGARYAQQSGVTPQHALEGARIAHQAGVRPQHVVQGAQMAHQAGLRPQHFVQGAKAAQKAGVTPQHVLAAGKAFAAPQR